MNSQAANSEISVSLERPRKIGTTTESGICELIAIGKTHSSKRRMPFKKLEADIVDLASPKIDLLENEAAAEL